MGTAAVCYGAFLTCAAHKLFEHRFIVFDSLLGFNVTRRHVVLLIFTLNTSVMVWCALQLDREA